MAEVWYKDGLQFRCTRCGNCCTGPAGYVWVTEEEIAAIAKFREEPLEQLTGLYVRKIGRRFSLKERANGDCVFYDCAKGCTIYPVRPKQCRTWPFWESNVVTPEAWKETCAVCPGSGTGDWIPAEEITRRIKVIRL
jgi:Fe-S-cluster containining protein